MYIFVQITNGSYRIFLVIIYLGVVVYFAAAAAAVAAAAVVTAVAAVVTAAAAVDDANVKRRQHTFLIASLSVNKLKLLALSPDQQ